mmetsp:Transcript_20440/g.30398  ORF Transcript_20440/g.30398 Transcript_20440/m.30398 type:complete len:465 (-) Transcript_20440:184-1578(-)
MPRIGQISYHTSGNKLRQPRPSPPGTIRRFRRLNVVLSVLFLLFITFQIIAFTHVRKNALSDGGATYEDESNRSLDMTAKGDIVAPQQPKPKIAYAVTLTSCGTDAYQGQNQPFVQGAAVLAHSIWKNSFENSFSGSKYGHALYAFVHPDAVHCSDPLSSLGFQILVRDTPINVTEIKGKFLREHVVKSGCCGEKEYIKLYSYTLTDHPIVVHLDLDCLILKPFDDLFDAMLDGPESPARERIKLMFPHDTSVEKSLPSHINAYFTRDYNMVNPGKKHVGVQGGFLVVRPNLDVFEEYRSIILEGNFRPGAGWGGQYGGYFGAQQIQGLCAYYYDHLHPGEAAELNRCYFNAMADKPIQQSSGKCRTGEDVCEDCSTKDVSDLYSVHFTLCQKPWLCRSPSGLCTEMHHEWFRMRKDMDDSHFQQHQLEGKEEVDQIASGNYRPEQFLGYCNGAGNTGYIPVKV